MLAVLTMHKVLRSKEVNQITGFASMSVIHIGDLCQGHDDNFTVSRARPGCTRCRTYVDDAAATAVSVAMVGAVRTS